MTKTPLIPLTMMTLSLAACGGPEGLFGTNLPPLGGVDVGGPGTSQGPDHPDNTPLAPPEAPVRRAVQPTYGGGLAGGAIDGVFTVFVQSEAGAPVAGAQVQLSEHLDAVGRSDAAGQVDFYGQALSGALDVHVFHEAYPFASMIEVSQSVATVVLGSADRTAPELPTASLQTPRQQELALQFLPWAWMREGVVQFGLRLGDGSRVLLDEQPIVGARPETMGPYLQGDLHDAEFWMAVLEHSEQTLDGAPVSERRAYRQAPIAVQTIRTMLEVPAVPEVHDRAIAFEPMTDAGLHTLELVEPGAKTLLWRITSFSQGLEPVTLPEPPVELQDPLAAAFTLELAAYDVETYDWTSEPRALSKLTLRSMSLVRVNPDL